MIYLEPCPFCGPACSSPELVQRESDLRWQVIHGPCGSATGHAKAPEDVIASWNFRNRFDRATGEYAKMVDAIREALRNIESDIQGSVVRDGRVAALRRELGLFRLLHKDRDFRKVSREEYVAGFFNRDIDITPLLEQLDQDDASIFERGNMNGHVTTSALVFTYDWTKVLLIDHKHLKEWLQPGGHYEGTGSFADSAAREVEEETGVVPGYICHMLLDVDTHPIPERPSKGEGAHRHHDLIYLMLASEYLPTPQEDEVSGARWVDVEEAAKLSPRMERVIRKALTHYLEMLQ